MTHRPASSISSHVTVDLEASGVVCGKDRVDAVLSLAVGVEIPAVTRPGAWRERERESACVRGRESSRYR